MDFNEILTPMEVILMECDSITYENKVYMFTWNPKPTFYQYDKNGNNDYKMQWITMIGILKLLHRCSNCYCIVPEISDDGKLHCHGWFRLDDKIKWIKSVKRKVQANGFMKINRLYVPIEKIDYYYKEIDETREILQETFAVITSFTLEEVLRVIRLRSKAWIDKLEKKDKKYAYDFTAWLEE